MSNSVQPHRQQPTRLPRAWDSPGKNTRVGCHFLLQCMKVKSQSEVAQSCPILSDLMNCSLPGSSVHGIFRARVLEWGFVQHNALNFHMYCNKWPAEYLGRAGKFVILDFTRMMFKTKGWRNCIEPTRHSVRMPERLYFRKSPDIRAEKTGLW